MDKKLFLLFLLLNILTFVYSQDNVGEGGDKQDKQVPTISQEPDHGVTTTTPSTPPSPLPPTSTTTSTSTNPTLDPQPPIIITTTTIPPKIIEPSDTKQPDETIQISNSALNYTRLIVTTSTTPISITPLLTTTTVKNKQSVTKTYPQSEFLPYDDNSKDTPLEYLGLLYVMSGIISTLLVIFASYTIYKKGLGDESNNNTKWDANYEDDGSRNKSTISRSTLTPSIRNTTLGSPSSNPSYPSNPSNPSNSSNSKYI